MEGTGEQRAPDTEAASQPAPEVEASTYHNSGVEGSTTANKKATGEEHTADAEVTPTDFGGDGSTGANPQEEAAARVSPPPSPRTEAAGGMSGSPDGGTAQATPTDKVLQIATSFSSVKRFNLSLGWSKDREEEAIETFKEAAKVSFRFLLVIRPISLVNHGTPR